jgi:hypothetical protein
MIVKVRIIKSQAKATIKESNYLFIQQQKNDELWKNKEGRTQMK